MSAGTGQGLERLPGPAGAAARPWPPPELPVEGVGERPPSGAPAHALSSPLQLAANALLFLGVNMYGVCVRVLAERAQRRAFLQARNCIEDRLRLEDENEKQVGGRSLRGALSGESSAPSFPRLMSPGLSPGFPAGPSCETVSEGWSLPTRSLAVVSILWDLLH